MKLKDRNIIYEKFEGHCAYCGCKLKKGWHVDHMFPRRKQHWLDSEEMMKLTPAPNNLTSIDDIRNLVPSCPRCNIWKSSFDIEQFRREIELQINRLRRDSSQFRMAEDFNLISINQQKVEFYFEKYLRERNNNGKVS